MYTISREMAYDLIRMYVERLHVGEVKHGMPGKKLEKWTVAKDGLTSLLVQIKLNGDDPDKILNDIKEELGIRFSHKELIIRIDGAARGNDNPDIDNKSALAFIIYGDGNEITRYAEYIGSHIIIPKSGIDDASVARATSNVAEYMSLISSLEYLIEKEITAPNIIFLSDSNVVVQQINGTNATRAPHLVKLRNRARLLSKRLPNFTIRHVPREENAEVDLLVNKILDEQETNA